ncbi:DUF2542 family protein [Candidatus Woesearchaeota archaeon]|nr:DUF2542 family protein [Candidatus Woesearchaeota archaeon]
MDFVIIAVILIDLFCIHKVIKGLKKGYIDSFRAWRFVIMKNKKPKLYWLFIFLLSFLSLVLTFCLFYKFFINFK